MKKITTPKFTNHVHKMVAEQNRQTRQTALQRAAAMRSNRKKRGSA